MRYSTFARILSAVPVILLAPIAVSAGSIAVTNLAPGASVVAASNVSFTVVATGISYPTYSVSDSFSGSSISANNINPGGNFSWTPWASDAGTHVLTITAQGSEGSASVSQTITVLPPPSISIGALSPGARVMPGTPLTFQVTALGFTNPTFTVGDTSSNPSVQPSNINASGYFSWTPTLSDNGEHMITAYVSDSLGHSASKSVSVTVGSGPSLSIVLLSPGASVSPGQPVTFTAAPSNFAPTGFSVQDSFPGSSANSNNMNLSGQFSWSPAQSDVGTHLLTITGVVGAFGASASTTQTITVLGAGGVAPATTTPPAGTSDTTLAALQAKLAALRSAIASQSAASGTGSQPSAGAIFVSYLKPGSSGDEVRALQDMLAQLGYLTATPNGNYGPATEAAVKAFQKAHGLDQLGVVGPGTRAALNGLASSSANPTRSPASSVLPGSFVFEHFMGVGDDDPDVLELQERLTVLGFYSGPKTGFYGPGTEAAVKRFQAAHGLAQTGYCAKDTRAALNQ